jgi:hypothetical protein
MGISTPVPAVRLRPASLVRHSDSANQNKEMDCPRASAQARSNTDLVAIPTKNQEENHG